MIHSIPFVQFMCLTVLFHNLSLSVEGSMGIVNKLPSLALVKSRLVDFWYELTWVFREKGPLNGCVCLCCRTFLLIGVCMLSLC